MKTASDAQRFLRRKHIVDLLLFQDSFRKKDICESAKDERPGFIGLVISDLVRDGYLMKDGQVGKVGYEINFNRYFYRYTPPRPLEEIEADIRTVEQEILAMLKEMTE